MTKVYVSLKVEIFNSSKPSLIAKPNNPIQLTIGQQHRPPAADIRLSHMGDFALSAIVSIGDLCAFVIGKALGRTLQLNRDKVQKIGQVVFASLIIGTGIVFTVLYS